MSTTRRLVKRARANGEPSPAQQSRNRESEASHEPTPLPPYEPPTCALTPSAKRALDDLHRNHDYSKYRKHLDGSIKALTNSIGDSNERLRLRKEALEKAKERRTRAGADDEERTNEEEIYCGGMDKNVTSMTMKAERALRDLIDYGDELAMKEDIMTEVSQNVAASGTCRSARRQRRQGSEDDENEEAESAEEDDEEAPVVSALEVLKKAKENYAANYATKSMRLRYDTNDYRGFKSTIHIATVGPNGPPVPHVKTWFPQDNQSGTASSRGGRNADDEDSDDEVVIASATLNTKCPLTLRVFEEPHVSRKCNHVFEKSAIVEYINNDGTAFVDPSQPGRGRGAKQVKCPQVGCEMMLQLDDFHVDNLLLRQLEQARRQAAREAEEDDDDDNAPRGTQRNRPTEIDEDDSIDVEEDQRSRIARVKRERQQSRGLSSAPGRQDSSTLGEDESEIMDVDVE